MKRCEGIYISQWISRPRAPPLDAATPRYSGPHPPRRRRRRSPSSELCEITTDSLVTASRMGHAGHLYDRATRTTMLCDGGGIASLRRQDGEREAAPVKQWIGQGHDARLTINARRREYDYNKEAGSMARSYRPHRGGHYDSGEDRSMSPEPPGLGCS